MMKLLLFVTLIILSSAFAVTPRSALQKGRFVLQRPQQRRPVRQEAAIGSLSGGGGDILPSVQEDKDEYRNAVVKTIITVASALLFGCGVWTFKGRTSALEFFTGYIVEQSLSVDNLFVFIMLFDYFKVPPAFQSRVLAWGIIGAIVMRGVMIVLGVAAIQRFRIVMLLFAGLLVVAGGRLIKESFVAEEEDEDLSNNWIMRVSKRLCNAVDYYDDEKFFTIASGVRRATPLLLCLVCIELSDFVFAVDSIPAVLGVSQDPLIVYSSNVFAIAALRSLYVLVAKAIDDLPYLKPAVGLVLGFVGAKMVAEFYHYEISTAISLGVIVGILALSLIGSVLFPPSNKTDAAKEVQKKVKASAA
mmetsp:Transcript_11886/g.44224  ORF Transcript_11886/g.44224 Transcript_11886/m.44224 type:complete len:360 (-) Transcript_11886:900-1979(-)